MAITIQMKPKLATAFTVSDPIMYSASSTNSGEDQFRFKLTLSITGGDDLVTLSVPPNDQGLGVFDVSKIARDALVIGGYVASTTTTETNPAAKRFTASIASRYLDANGDEQTETAITADFHAFVGRNLMPVPDMVVSSASPDIQSTNWRRPSNMFTRDEFYQIGESVAWGRTVLSMHPLLSDEQEAAIFGNRLGKDETEFAMQQSSNVRWLGGEGPWCSGALAHSEAIWPVGTPCTKFPSSSTTRPETRRIHTQVLSTRVEVEQKRSIGCATCPLERTT